MDIETSDSTLAMQTPPPLKLRYLTQAQLIRLEKLLDDVGEYGELHLIIEKGRIKFVQLVKSQKL